MKILFLTHYFHPHIGGVEKHTLEIAKSLVKKGHKVTIITHKYDPKLKSSEIFTHIKIIRFSYPYIKFFGLFHIWFWLFNRRDLFKNADIIHIHDVFIWYLPFKFLYPFKKVYTTFHGWEGIWPIPAKNILLKKIAAGLSEKTTAVGDYIRKYYGIKPNRIIYGATNTKFKKYKKIKNKIIFIGRLDEDTGILKFLTDVEKHRKWSVEFVGDGNLRKECEKYGEVRGFTDPARFLKGAEYAVPGGYLSYIEANAYGCKIKVYSGNPLKAHYWAGIQEQKDFPTWDKLADEYIGLYNSSK